jgi:DNA-binding MarR family transcriptional regulator
VAPTNTTSTLSADLLDVAIPLPRLLRRRVREDWPLDPLPGAQLSVLVAVRRSPGISVGETAAELRVAHNTASTLVNRLVQSGMLERRPDARDRRTVRLHLTPAAENRMAAWRDRRRQVLEATLGTLSETDREAIAEALPALARLTERLER